MMTSPCLAYFADAARLLGFISFVSGLALRADEVVRVAAKALYDERADEAERTKYQKQIERGAGTTEALRLYYRQLVLQMTLSRATDNYLSYVSELLSLVFQTKPETLRSSEQVRLDEVLRHSSMDELIGSLSERRVERLAYLGMADLADDLEEKLGFALFETEEDLQGAIRVNAIRNLVVHNRAIINAKFVEQLPQYEGQQGQSLELDVDEVFGDITFLTRIVCETDGRAAKKFVLPRPHTREHFDKDLEQYVER